MKRLIPIIIIIVILLTNIASAETGDIKPRVDTNLTKMLQTFIEDRLEFHNREYYCVFLHFTFPKGEAFKDGIKSYSLIDGKALIPSNYYFDVLITSSLIWVSDAGEDKLYPSDMTLYHYKYYPNTGEYELHCIPSSFNVFNFGNELMFTNFNGPHGIYKIGEYTLLNPKGNQNYWGNGVEIYHDIKLYDKIQLDSVKGSAYYEGYNIGKEVGLQQVIKENVAYGEGMKAGYNNGYYDGFNDGQTTTDETTRNILAFGGSVIGSILSFILYVGTNIEILGINLLDVLVALAIITILVFVLKLIKG